MLICMNEVLYLNRLIQVYGRAIKVFGSWNQRYFGAIHSVHISKTIKPIVVTVFVTSGNRERYQGASESGDTTTTLRSFLPAASEYPVVPDQTPNL